MMTRKERRAVEHATRKADHKSGFPTPEPVVANITEAEEPVTAPEAKPQISEAQLAANRANAQFSTGATSEAGKKKVSLNALKTGLTGRQVLLPADDGALYEAMVRDYQNHFNPVGPEETALVQSIVDVRWRLERFPGLESALLDVGRKLMLEIEPKLAGNPAPVFELQIRQHYEKKFRNLELQENRLVRRRERETKELRELQAGRKAAGQEAKAKPTEAAKPNAASAPAGNGFEFSPSQICAYLASLTPEARENLLLQMLMPPAFAAETTSAAA